MKHDCLLVDQQQDGINIMLEMLAELKALNTSLVGPATGRQQVSSKIYIWTIVPMAILILVLILRDAQKDFHATGPGGTSLHLEKKTE
jgi:hypothetical protein